jgi:hypothetical protein
VLKLAVLWRTRSHPRELQDKLLDVVVLGCRSRAARRGDQLDRQPLRDQVHELVLGTRELGAVPPPGPRSTSTIAVSEHRPTGRHAPDRLYELVPGLGYGKRASRGFELEADPALDMPGTAVVVPVRSA